MGSKPKKEKHGNPIVAFFDRLSDGCLVFGCLTPIVFLISPVLFWVMYV